MELLAREGADEFFCGYLPGSGLKESQACLYLNRRAVPSANFLRMDDLVQALALAARHDKPVYITFNEHFYSQALYDEILAALTRMELKPPNGVIVSDVGLILMLRKRFPELPLVASTGCPVFNERTLKFYKDIGIRRITLSVALTMAEIKRLAAAAAGLGIELECFVKNESCINTNALCTYLHGWNDDPVAKPFCRVDRTYSLRNVPPEMNRRAHARLQDLALHCSEGCGACRVPQFISAGVQGVKIDARSRPTRDKINDLHFIKGILERIHGGMPPDGIKPFIRNRFRDIYGRDCENKCIYS